MNTGGLLLLRGLEKEFEKTTDRYCEYKNACLLCDVCRRWFEEITDRN